MSTVMTLRPASQIILGVGVKPFNSCLALSQIGFAEIALNFVDPSFNLQTTERWTLKSEHSEPSPDFPRTAENLSWSCFNVAWSTWKDQKLILELNPNQKHIFQ